MYIYLHVHVPAAAPAFVDSHNHKWRLEDHNTQQHTRNM